jgi:hypothetical protein
MSTRPVVFWRALQLAAKSFHHQPIGPRVRLQPSNDDRQGERAP